MATLTTPSFTREVELQIDAGPHEGTEQWPGGQRLLIEAALRYRTVTAACGRRFGKTRSLEFLFLEEGAQTDGLYSFGYVAQGHPFAQRQYDRFLEDFADLVEDQHGDKGQARWIRFKPWGRNWGAIAYFWSGEAGALKNVRGEGLHRLCLDERGEQPKAVLKTFRPMLLDQGGKVLGVGTPNPEGEGFASFQRDFLKGIDRPGIPRTPGFCSLRFPSEANPYIRPEDAMEERLALRIDPNVPSVEEQTEIDALFVRDIGAVFTNIESTMDLPFRAESANLLVGTERDTSSTYIAGLDFGKFKDATVLSIFDWRTGHQVALLRFDGTDYDEQLPLVVALIDRYACGIIVADERDAGAYLCERLRTVYGTRIIGVKLTRGGVHDKGAYVTRARHLFQKRGWRLLADERQIEEFALYTKTELLDGHFRYAAPEGHHDDHVSAALLASRHLQLPFKERAQSPKPPEFFSIDSILARQRARMLTSQLGEIADAVV